MITKIVNNSSFQSFSLPPDRPPQLTSFRKLLFFLLREGASSTLGKIASKLFKHRNLDQSVFGACIDGKAAVSFDGGRTFYLHADGASIAGPDEWYSPFGVDDDVRVEEPQIIELPAPGSLFVIGAGDYAKTYALRHFKGVPLFAAVDYNDVVLESIASEFATTANHFKSIIPAWQRAQAPIAIIASHHSDHAIQAHTLFNENAKGFIFVEKPPMVDHQRDFELFQYMYTRGAKLEIGFNRRHAPAVKLLHKKLDGISGPSFINISVNEVQISATHWYHWPNQGTRITGNSCHWIDLCQFIVKADPVKLTMTSSPIIKDGVVLTIAYADGSVACMSFSDNGSTLRGVQETIEVKRNGHTFFIDDFLSLRHDSQHGRNIHRFFRRDKGHNAMYASFQQRVNNDISGGPTFQTTYPLEHLKKVTKVTEEFSRMLMEGISSMSI